MGPEDSDAGLRLEGIRTAPRCEHEPRPGQYFRDGAGGYWETCKRNRPDAPMQASNLDTGELCMLVDIHVAEWIDVKLSAVLRWLGDVERVTGERIA